MAQSTFRPERTFRADEHFFRTQSKRLTRPSSLCSHNCYNTAKVYENLLAKLHWFARLSTQREVCFIEFDNERRTCDGCADANHSIDDYCCTGESTCTDCADDDDCDSTLEAILLSQEIESVAVLQGRNYESHEDGTMNFMEENANQIAGRFFHVDPECMGRRRCFSMRCYSRSHSLPLSRSYSIDSNSSSSSGSSNGTQLESESRRHEPEHDSLTNITEFESAGDTERRLRILEMKVDRLVAQVAQLCCK
ncbi:unnamed protein product [Toxocara canis]|uniref:Lzipper-MIP1 domain-containing protein n=1 Tax=Toxocara canis TaxID=6265 RepID=A0A183USW5_TOXCA|nr:unnamed protein product [Toxocara canis]